MRCVTVLSLAGLVLFSCVSRQCRAAEPAGGEEAAPSPTPSRVEPTPPAAPEPSPAPSIPAADETASREAAEMPVEQQPAASPAPKRRRSPLGITLTCHPFVELEGEETDPAAGWGIELSCFSPQCGGWNFPDSTGLRLLWSHHEEGPGSPGAEYFRLWMPMMARESIDLPFAEKSPVDLLLSCGPTLNLLLVDGDGDAGGVGYAAGAELTFRLNRSISLSAGADAHAWIGFEGESFWGYSTSASLMVRF